MPINRLLIVIFSLVIIANAQQIKPITENWSPYQIKNGKHITGISIDIVKEIQKRINNTQKIRMFPWNRAYNMALQNKGYALFTTAKTKEREKLFKWVGPISKLSVLSYKLRENKKEFNTIDDLRTAKLISVTKNDATHQKLESLGFKNIKVKTAGSNEINLNQLIQGKTELWSSDYYSGQYRLKQRGLKGLVVLTKAPPILETSLYIAFNINEKDSVIQKWQKTFDEIKKDGTLEKIMNRYK